MSLQMKPSDLGELYTLLTMYQNVYGGVEDRFLAEIADNYHRSTTCFVCDGGKDHTVNGSGTTDPFAYANPSFG